MFIRKEPTVVSVIPGSIGIILIHCSEKGTRKIIMEIANTMEDILIVTPVRYHLVLVVGLSIRSHCFFYRKSLESYDKEAGRKKRSVSRKNEFLNSMN